MTQVGFQNRQKGIVDSSFDKAQESGEKLVGKNAGRRNDAYVSRLEGLVAKYGNRLEKKLWDASVEKLVIEPEEIEENYWKTQEQILRDNGQGRELSDYEKNLLAEDIQKQQRESLQNWANYLGDEGTPYPMWFKVYAWDGMSKMGVFDKEKQEFKRRNKHTVAPYLHLNQAVLGKVYGAMDEFYRRNAEGGEGERDKVLDALVQSGSFSKLYAKFLLEQKAAPKTPERTEDVHGEWVEYLPGQEEELAMAAEGTPWCVVSPAVGRNYLELGNFAGNQNDWEEDEDWYEDEYYDEDGEWEDSDEEDFPVSENDGAENETSEAEKNEEPKSRAKFILFHLRDPETGMLAENACASIRLDPDGRVAEISGLNEGQALEDALVPIVEEKVKTLDGGEEFLGAFADKKKLIELDRKMQKEEALNNEDILFLAGDIRVLDTYNEVDPRIPELLRYISRTADRGQLEEVLKENPDRGEILKAILDDQRAQYLDKKLCKGEKFSGDELRFIFDRHTQVLNDFIDERYYDRDVLHSSFPWRLRSLSYLIENGNSVDEIVQSQDSIENWEEYLKETEANIEDVMARAKRGVAGYDVVYAVFEKWDELFGKDVDATQVLHGLMRNDDLSRWDIPHHAPDFLKKGVELEELDKVVDGGVTGISIARTDDSKIIMKYLDVMLERGASINDAVRHMNRDAVVDNLEELVKHGAARQDGWNKAALVDKLESDEIVQNLEMLVKNGAELSVLVDKMSGKDVEENFQKLLELGAYPRVVLGKMTPDGVLRNLDVLVNQGLDINRLALHSSMNLWREHFDEFAARGATPEGVLDEARRMGIPSYVR